MTHPQRLLSTPERLSSNQLFASETFTESLVERDYRLGPVVLIVEDEPITRSLLSNVLSGHVQEKTPSAEEGLCLYARLAPDIVFLDIDLPDGNGLNVLETILMHDQMAFVVMMTARSTEANVKKAIQLGAQGFLAKPFNVARIKECMTRWQDTLIPSRKRKVVL